jgi:septal ring factor EnvC (AmiA/AmiB activator)
MSDPTDLVLVGGGGLTVGGLIVGLLKWLGSRNISALDKTLSELASAVTELRKEVRELREANIAQAKDIGSLQKDNELLRERLDGLAGHWRQQFDEYRKLVHDRMEEATRAMISHGEAMVSAAAAATKRGKK